MIATLLATALVAAPSPTAEHPIVVGETPVSRGALRHWADIAQRSSGGGDRRGARQQAAALVIAFRWILGEADERGVTVTRAQVDRRYRAQRDEVFPRRRAYRRFLRESGQSARDVRFRVRLDLLSQRLRKLAVEGAATPEEQQERLDAFVRAFRAKWRARTACREPWVSELDCRATSPGRTRRSRAPGPRASRWDGGLGGIRIPSRARFRPIAPGS